MKLPLVATALVAVAAGGAAAVYLLGTAPSGNLPHAGEIAVTGAAKVGGPFSLVDGAGKRVTDKDFLGHHLLVYFGYTFCPDVCPSGLQVISSALDELGPAAADITPVFITIDPARDTPAKMSEYVKSFHPRLIGLTGTAEEVAAVVKAYRVYARKAVDPAHPDDYTMDHSSVVYLMGPDGKLKMLMGEAVKSDVLAGQLRQGLAKKGA